MSIDKQNHAMLKALMRFIGVIPSWSLLRNKASEHIGQFTAQVVAQLLEDSEVVTHPTEGQLVGAYSFGYQVVHALAGRVNVPTVDAMAAFALPFKREHFSYQADAVFNLRMASVHGVVLSKAPQFERAVRDAARALLNGGAKRNEAFTYALDDLTVLFEQYVVEIPKLCIQNKVLG